jgi:hypothetical protein
MDIKKWLIDRPCLSLRCLEKEARLPTKTLSHFVNGRRELNVEHIKKVTEILLKYGFKQQ